MKKIAYSLYILIFLNITLGSISCNEPVKKDLPGEKKHPKLKKTSGNGNLSSILQDKDGNLWLGTSHDGLFKYDGKTFRPFELTNGLNDKDVSCLLEDTDGKIWIGTKAGLGVKMGNRYVTIKIPVPRSLPPNQNPHFQNHWVYSMMQDTKGKLWFVTIDGVYVYDNRSLTTGSASFTHFPMNEAPNGFMTPNDKVERILEDKDGNIWLGGRTNEGVYRYDGKTVTNLKPMDLFQKGPKPKAHNWGGAYRYDGKTFTSYTAKDGLPSEVTRIIEDQKGNLWFGCSDGLRRYDGTTFTFYKKGLINPWIWAILEDNNGNLWIGTRDQGLYLFDGQTFINYSEDKK